MAEIIINENKLLVPQKYWKSEQIVFGKPSPSRNNQPSMKELMTWEEPAKIIKYKTEQADSIYPNEGQSKLLQLIEEKNKNIELQNLVQSQQSQIPKNISKCQKPEVFQLQTECFSKNDEQFKQLQSQQTSTKPKTTKKNKKIKPSLQNTRDLPNTSYCKLIGKPIFDAGYGSKNINPTSPQQFTNNFMLTFNVNPHSGKKAPVYQQTYYSALAHEKEQLNNYPVRKSKVQKKEIQKEIVKKIEINKNQQNQQKNIKAKNCKNKETKNVKQPPPSLQTPVQETQQQIKDSLRYYETTFVPNQEQIQNLSVVSEQLSASQFRDKEKRIRTMIINESIKKQLEKETLKQKDLIAEEQKEIEKIKQKISAIKQEPQIDEVYYQKIQLYYQKQIQALQKQQEVNQFAKNINLKSKCNEFLTPKITNLNKYYKTKENQEKQENQLLTLSYSLNTQDLHSAKPTLYQMSPMEVNPKHYGEFEGKWLNRIPAAGGQKKQQKLTCSIETFDFHQPYYSIHL